MQALLPREDDEHWWPWPDKAVSTCSYRYAVAQYLRNPRQTCLLDVMGAFPRAMQSESGMRATRWHATKHGVSRLPTVRVTKSCREAVKAVGGVPSETHQGQQGHLYTMNGLHNILRRVSLLKSYIPASIEFGLICRSGLIRLFESMFISIQKTLVTHSPRRGKLHVGETKLMRH